MDRLNGVIIEGEKLGLEKYTGKDNKPMVNLHILCGFESIKLSVRDANIVQTLEKVGSRQQLRVKAEVMTYKDKLYLSVQSLIS